MANNKIKRGSKQHYTPATDFKGKSECVKMGWKEVIMDDPIGK
jgi:hypothetical protein